MTMQQMNEYLEKKGFDVNRIYMKQQGIYQFQIRKDGHVTCANFKYPETNDWNHRNDLMQEFLDRIIRAHERHYVTDMDAQSMYPDPEKFWTKENPHIRIKDYITSDIEVTKSIYKRMVNSMYGANPYYRPEIKDVIFNDPATIVFWTDGTKTVVKCQEGDEFDPEKGLTMAIAKKVYGNKGSYCNVIKKWVEPYYEKQAETEALAHELTVKFDGGILCKNLKDLFGPIRTGEMTLTFTGKKIDEERDS